MRTFEFLGACARGQVTHRPGPKSFTNALIWALRELRKERVFNSLKLLHKIQNAPDFPKKKQSPQLIPRFSPSDDHIWIAPLNAAKEAFETPLGEYRQPGHEYLDLRFHFYRGVNDTDIRNTAQALSRLIKTKDDDFSAKRISLIKKNSDFKQYAKYWQDFAKGQKRKRSFNDGMPSPLLLTPLSDEGATSSLQLPAPDSVGAPPTLKLSLEVDVESTAMMTLDGDNVGHLEEQPPAIRRRLAYASEHDHPNEGTLYHFKMLMNCTMENCRTFVGRMADKVSYHVW